MDWAQRSLRPSPMLRLRLQPPVLGPARGPSAAAYTENAPAAWDGRRGGGDPPMQGELPDATIAHRDRIAAALGDAAFQPEGHRIAGRLGKWWRKIDAGTPQAGLERSRRRITARVDCQLPIG